MSDLRLRLKTRAYLGVTGVFYLLVGLAYSSEHLQVATTFRPGIGWACLFLLAGIVTLFSWFNAGYKTGRQALLLCASASAGFSALFLSKVIGGDFHYVLASVIWAYMALSHLSVARLPDPFILALFQSEVKRLEARLTRIPKAVSDE